MKKEEILNSAIIERIEQIMFEQINNNETPDFEKSLDIAKNEYEKFCSEIINKTERGNKIKNCLCNMVYIHNQI